MIEEMTAATSDTGQKEPVVMSREGVEVREKSEKHSWAVANWIHRLTQRQELVASSNDVDTREGAVISVGQKYSENRAGAPVWIVDKVSHIPMSKYPLVHLKRETMPDISKTLSALVLEERNTYKRIG